MDDQFNRNLSMGLPGWLNPMGSTTVANTPVNVGSIGQAPTSTTANPADPGTPASGPDTNTAASNPDVQFAIDQMKKRYGGDNGATQAIDLAGGAINTWAQGQRRAARGREAARGVSGSGIAGYDDRNVDSEAQRQLAGAAANIANEREQAKDSTLRDISSSGATQAGIGLADRSLNLHQWEATQQNQRAQEAAQAAQLAAIMSMMNQVSAAVPTTPAIHQPAPNAAPVFGMNQVR